MLFRGIFHPVGNALTYTGHFLKNNTFFVYDLGYDRKRLYYNHLKWFFEFNLKKYNEKPLLLTISHFHIDHILFLPEFLKLFKPKIIILPYFYSKEKLQVTFILASMFSKPYIYKKIPPSLELLRFLIDPIKYIREISPESIIYLVVGYGPEFLELITDDTEVPDTRVPVGEITYLGPIIEKNDQENIIIVDGKGYWSTTLYDKFTWLFRVYNILPYNKTTKNILKNFKDDIYKKFGKNPENFSVSELYDLLNKKDFIKFLRRLYKKHFKNLNITSIQMWHGSLIPFNSEIKLCPFIIPCIHCYPYQFYTIHPCYIEIIDEFYIKTYNIGTYLSGDLPLNKYNSYVINNIKKHFNRLLQKTQIVQIPHHGSRVTWHKNYLNLFPKKSIYVLSGIKSIPFELYNYYWTRYLYYDFI